MGGWFLGSLSTVVLMFVWVYVVVFRGVLYCGALTWFVAFSVWWGLPFGGLLVFDG